MTGLKLAANPTAFVQGVPQVAICIFQAYRLWDEISNVPEKIRFLVTTLETYGPIFREIEERFDQPNAPGPPCDHSALRISFDCAKQAQKALEDMLQDLQTELDTKRGVKRKGAAFKVIMKKRELDNLEKRLSQSLSLLQLALQAYHLAQQSISYGVLQNINSEYFANTVASVVVKRINEPENRPAEEMSQKKDQKSLRHKNRVVPRPRNYSASFSSSVIGQCFVGYTKGRKSWQARVQLPDRLSRTVYELHSRSALGAWTVMYRTYNIIPDGSEVFQCIEKGDKERVLELFGTKQASPYDRDKCGRSLLYTAAKSFQPELCQVLLGMGLSDLLDETVDKHRTSPLSIITYSSVRPGSNQAPSALDQVPSPTDGQVVKVARLFRSYLRVSNAIPAERLLDFMPLWGYQNTYMTMFQDMFMPAYYSSSLAERLEAIRLAAFFMHDCWALQRLLSPERIVTSADVKQSTHEKFSLVHTAALGFACRFPDELMPTKKPYPHVYIYSEDWSDFVTEITRKADKPDLYSVEQVVPSNLQQVPVWKGTPFTSVIGGALCYMNHPNVSFTHCDNLLQGTLQRWLVDLQAAGVDLLEYGLREIQNLHGNDYDAKGAFDSEAIRRSRKIPRTSLLKSCQIERYGLSRHGGPTRNDYYWIPIRLIDLKIGPHATDWMMLWAPEFEHMANEFWAIIENHDIKIPGAWVD